MALPIFALVFVVAFSLLPWLVSLVAARGECR